MSPRLLRLGGLTCSLLLVAVACSPNVGEDEDEEAIDIDADDGDFTTADDIDDDEVIVYGVHQDHVMERVLNAFEQATGISYSMVRLSSGEATTRVIQEMDAPAADVVLAGPSENHEVMAQEGALEAYESPTLAEYDQDWSSPENMWHGYYIGPLAIGVNTDLWESEMGTEDIDIETWDDLLDDRFDGEIVMASPLTSGTAYNFVATQVFRLGEDAAWDYLSEFDQLVGQYTTSGGAPAQMVGTGEYMLGITFVHDMLAVADAGFAVEPIIPEETGYEVGSVSLVAGGPNPEAGRALIDFVLSAAAGQQQTDLSMNLSLHPDVVNPPAAPDMDELDIVEFDVGEAASQRDAWLDAWEDRIGGQPDD